MSVRKWAMFQLRNLLKQQQRKSQVNNMNLVVSDYISNIYLDKVYDPSREKIGFLHKRKQRRRSPSR